MQIDEPFCMKKKYSFQFEEWLFFDRHSFNTPIAEILCQHIRVNLVRIRKAGQCWVEKGLECHRKMNGV